MRLRTIFAIIPSKLPLFGYPSGLRQYELASRTNPVKERTDCTKVVVFHRMSLRNERIRTEHIQAFALKNQIFSNDKIVLSSGKIRHTTLTNTTRVACLFLLRLDYFRFRFGRNIPPPDFQSRNIARANRRSANPTINGAASRRAPTVCRKYCGPTTTKIYPSAIQSGQRFLTH